VAVRAAFVYANPRAGLVREIEAGRAPDTPLLGQNHLADFGVESWVHDPALTRSRPRLPFRLAWSLRELTLPWEVDRADVVCTPLALLFPLAARIRGRPRALVLNMGLCTRFARSSTAQRRLLHTALASAAGVVSFASAQRDRIVEQAGLAPERAHVVLFGVDERFYPVVPPATDGYVLAVGRDLARDYRTFAAAVEGLDASTVVVASERNLTDVRLPRNVEVRLDVTYAELRELYAGAACVVVPTRRESYPYGADCSGHTVLLEAFASARPVVLSERSTNGDYTAGTALEVPAEDPAALRTAIERVLGDRALADGLAAAGRRLVEERLTTRHLGGRLAPLIEAAGSGGAAG
jgi:glycosyltransferase involved in cell wall biosynthesis